MGLQIGIVLSKIILQAIVFKCCNTGYRCT